MQKLPQVPQQKHQNIPERKIRAIAESMSHAWTTLSSAMFINNEQKRRK
jgi:hypothetical protein